MCSRLRSPAAWGALLAAAGVLNLLSPHGALAQGTGDPTVSDSKTGYIDPAVPGDVFRLRFDDAFNNFRATRAEFFYAKSGPSGPGLPQPEPRVDYQELMPYLEVAVLPQLSGFVELPERFLHPEVNPSAAGLSDMNAGLKYAFLYGPDLVATFQFRTYIPTGNATKGLGNNHVSLEPALLFYKPLTDRLGMSGELRAWVPAGGTDFAGDMVRYGLGLQYGLYGTDRVLVTPVVELVGWTVLDGKESAVYPSAVVVKEATGDTILDAKVGVRLTWDGAGDFYAGYGRPLTGDRWYDHIFRLELRLFF
jgi:hypothetical protein